MSDLSLPAQALNSEHFSASDAVGGVRGVIESIAPGLLFVVVFVASGQQVMPAVLSAGAAALVAVVARLAQRTPITQALSGALGVGIGVVWAWRTGNASDYFAYGLWTNVAYLAAFGTSVLAGRPAVGYIAATFAKDGPLAEGGSWRGATQWRADRTLRRRYTLATMPLVALFGLRLLVQVPLYFADQVVALGTAKLVMGVPLTVLAVWVAWLVVRAPE